MSFLDQSYLETESYLGEEAGEAPQPMPAPEQGMMPIAQTSDGLVQIPFTDFVVTKQTALLLAAALAVGAWYFFIYKKE